VKARVYGDALNAMDMLRHEDIVKSIEGAIDRLQNLSNTIETIVTSPLKDRSSSRKYGRNLAAPRAVRTPSVELRGQPWIYLGKRSIARFHGADQSADSYLSSRPIPLAHPSSRA
jgi:hypothetical protein